MADRLKPDLLFCCGISGTTYPESHGQNAVAAAHAPWHGAYLRDMQTFLAKCTALAVLLGGFAITGDFSRLAARGTALLNATGVPNSGEPPADQPPGGPAWPLPPTTAEPAGQPVPAAEAPPAPEPPPPVVHATDAPLGRRVSQPSPPANAADAIDLASLQTGDRMLVWIGRSATTTAVLAFDIVDPAAGEALEHRHLFDDNAAVHAAPRRVRLAGESTRAGLIMRGGMLRLLPLGIVHGTQTGQEPEMIGPVQGLQVQR